LQRERANRQRLELQARRAAERAVEKAARERDQARRAALREAAANEKERKKLYIEDRKAEAAMMAADLQSRVAELESVLAGGLRREPGVTFSSLKRTARMPAFDPGGLDSPLTEPQWAQFAPRPPGAVGRMLGGGARYSREETAARAAYEEECARHGAAESDRLRRLAERRQAYDREAVAAARAVADHNAGVDQFERDFRAAEPEAVAQFLTLALDGSAYPEGFAHRTRVLYRPEPQEIVVEYELPPQSVIPVERDFRYVQNRDEIDTLARPVKEIKERYARLIAMVALRTIHEIYAADQVGLAAVATFNGHVSTKDPATGQPVRPCLISASAPRDLFATFVLADLDPVRCLHKLNALVSLHPYDLEAVRPVVDFEALLSQYKFVFGGLCVIQAKRYRGAVGVEAVRALAGVMEDKHATKGIMVTTSWVTKDGHAFTARHGRIQIIECEEIKYLCKEHLGLDVLISLPKPPPQRR
jgi:restriction system protein